MSRAANPEGPCRFCNARRQVIHRTDGMGRVVDEFGPLCLHERRAAAGLCGDCGGVRPSKKAMRCPDCAKVAWQRDKNRWNRDRYRADAAFRAATLDRLRAKWRDDAEWRRHDKMRRKAKWLHEALKQEAA